MTTGTTTELKIAMCLDIKKNNKFAHSPLIFGHISLPSVHYHDVNPRQFSSFVEEVTKDNGQIRLLNF